MLIKNIFRRITNTKSGNIAFVGNLFHQQTQSTKFLIDILRNRYNIDFYFGLPRNQLKEINFSKLESKRYDSIILLQVMPETSKMARLKCNNIIMIPMYDQVVSFSDEAWQGYRKYKFLNFSLELHKKHLSLGFISSYFKFFPEPVRETINISGPLRGFFWQRRNEITWKEIRRLIEKSDFASFHIHRAVDPGCEFVAPSDDEIKRYEITFSDWFEDKADYYSKVSESNIFFASRLYEGIGMSFLEAMAMGKCVVAPNRPTMNDYIRTGHNGILYELNEIRPLNYDDVEHISQNTLRSVQDGHAAWVKSIKDMIRFIEEKKS